ncbi:HAMP domain-containing histidine kinase [Butyrivibrio sp. DSM 10294]|uniref:sensor histidine kinase n=1 Tax=Butyrivibrio sp. DSM 10294 TaxID=2972457 RepID=UPI00234F4EF4|nr:HAMP domain-containing sensor histidine kinase [Butyrivibrio sp. DSM 10294]MDC7293329.1 HAMP domain-containing histidine kinase [Butyrivibrio sp. DSM 10294]
MKSKREKRKSIFSRLVKSYILFLIITILVYLVLAVALLIYFGNGSMSNASPQSFVHNDGTIADTEVLSRVGGWIEELDDSGNVINVVGDKLTDKYSYDLTDMAKYLDMGYASYEKTGIVLREFDVYDDIGYSALVRYAGDPKRIFLVFYPLDMVNYKISYMITNDNGGRYIWFLVIIATMFGLEIAGISFYLKRHIDMPLKLLMKGMNEVSEGKRDVVIDYKTDREFEDIRDRFNEMAVKLKETEEQKHQIEQSRNLLLLELAHDIKNPVASIKSSVYALKEGLVTEDKKDDYYKVIEMKVERISTLIADLNTSLKIDSDAYKLNLEKTDICELVRRNCVEFYEEIAATGKEFDIDIPDEAVFANLDTQLFRRAVSNLLANANKYNETGSNVGVRILDDSGKITIEVYDDGEAIDEEFAARMFESFARGDKTRKTDGGTGLGLAISRKIVERHHGTLKYKRSGGRNCFVIDMKKCA